MPFLWKDFDGGRQKGQVHVYGNRFRRVRYHDGDWEELSRRELEKLALKCGDHIAFGTVGSRVATSVVVYVCVSEKHSVYHMDSKSFHICNQGIKKVRKSRNVICIRDTAHRACEPAWMDDE